MDKKVALVTGGTRGIGKAISLELARNGYNIILNYRNANDELNETKKEIEEIGVECFLVYGDISKFEDCENIVKKAIEKFEKIDVLINNAGITRDGLIMRMKKDDFDTVVDTNLGGTFNMSRCVVPYMIKKKEGRIVNIASVVGVVGNAGQTNYSASKAGIIGFTKSLAKELASRNILVNAIAPGFIGTNMTDMLNDTQKETILGQIPLKRMGTPEEVAKLAKFLVSDDSKYITGQVINIDGGMVM